MQEADEIAEENKALEDEFRELDDAAGADDNDEVRLSYVCLDCRS